MRLNKLNIEKEKEENEEEEKEEEEEEKEEEEEEEEKNEKRHKKNQKQTHKNEDEVEEDENDDNEYTDNNKGKMIANSKYEKVKGKKIIKIPKCEQIPLIDKNKTLLKIMLTIVGIFISLLIIVNVGVAIVKSHKKKNMRVNFMNDEVRILNSFDINRFSKLKDDLLIAYCTEGILNLNKFYEENINQKTYITPDSSLSNIHISIGFSDAFVDEIIKHLSSALEHLSSSSYLHVHIMNADNFTLETFTKIMNMVHKINNKTEIIMYNANKIKDDFKIREDKGISFHIDYARLYAFKEIKDIKKIIMLNLENIMIEKDLSELYDAEMIDIYGRGLPEVPTFRHSEDWIDSYLFDKSHFINGDVILINLELCQKDNFYDKAKELNNDEFYKKTDNPTQDILNILMRKKVEFLNPKYNKISFYENPDDKNDETKWYPWVAETIKYGEKNNHFYTKEDLLNADSDPVIINYLWENHLNKKVIKYQEEMDKYARINNFIK